MRFVLKETEVLYAGCDECIIKSWSSFPKTLISYCFSLDWSTHYPQGRVEQQLNRVIYRHFAPL